MTATVTKNTKKVTDKDLRNYKAAAGQTAPERAAEYLDWLARVAPGRCAPVTYIMKVAYELPSVPRDNTDAVNAFRKGKLKSIKKVLYDKYRRAFRYVFATGYRASIDDNDIIESFVPSGRLGAAVRAIDLTISLTKRSNLNAANKMRYDSFSCGLKAMQAPVDKILGAGDKDKKDE